MNPQPPLYESGALPLSYLGGPALLARPARLHCSFARLPRLFFRLFFLRRARPAKRHPKGAKQGANYITAPPSVNLDADPRFTPPLLSVRSPPLLCALRVFVG